MKLKSKEERKELVLVSARVIKEARIELGLSLEEVSSKSGVPLKIIVGFEAGRYQKKIEEHQKVLEALGLYHVEFMSAIEKIWYQSHTKSVAEVAWGW